MDNCWDCGAKLKNPIRKYCAKCWDKRMVERERQEREKSKEIILATKGTRRKKKKVKRNERK